MTSLYFAYGSNLLDREIRRDAQDAEVIGPAYLSDHKLVFEKHSTTRCCDAASIKCWLSSEVSPYHASTVTLTIRLTASAAARRTNSERMAS